MNTNISKGLLSILLALMLVFLLSGCSMGEGTQAFLIVVCLIIGIIVLVGAIAIFGATALGCLAMGAGYIIVGLIAISILFFALKGCVGF